MEKILYVKMNADYARRLLAQNDCNRKLDENRVRQYANDMANGLWERDNLVSNIISVEKATNRLKDGQHRLYAIIKSGITLDMVITYVEEKTHIFDMQKPRTTLNIMKMNGTDATIQMVQTANKHLSRDSGRKISPAVLENYVVDNFELLREATQMVFVGHNPITKKSPFMHAVYVALKAGVQKEKLIDFCEIVATGRTNGCPEWLAENALKARDKILQIAKTNQTTIIAWESAGIYEEYIYRFVNGLESKGHVRKPHYVYTNCVDEIEKRNEVNNERF